MNSRNEAARLLMVGLPFMMYFQFSVFSYQLSVIS